MRGMTSLTLAMLAILTPPLRAQQPPAADRAWNDLARADVAAALQLIETNHPGASAELGDTDFLRRLQSARALADQRLPLVRDYGGHAAVLNGLANAFGDGHIRSDPILSLSRRTWTGIVMARRAGRWVVGSQAATDGEPDLKSAQLVACEGIEAEQFARQRIGTFLANPDVEADMARRAASLLLDDGNPFVKRPARCTFDRPGGGQVNFVLNWRPVPLRTLEQVAGEAYRPARAGMGVSAFAGGQWIGLETLSNDAAKVVEEARRQQAILRAAPMVVVDLRGNSGGNSQYADEIARVLVGEARVAAVNRGGNDCDGTYWRVSPDNSRALRKFAGELPADRAGDWIRQADALEAAVANKAIFSPALPACARRDKQGAPIVPSRMPATAMSGRLVLLTDRACFSSCLMATSLFRRLGALHVGEATDMGTRYIEVREITLPSGLRTFATLQKVALGVGDFGPYAPAVTFPGPLDEDDRLKAWVAALPR